VIQLEIHTLAQHFLGFFGHVSLWPIPHSILSPPT